jgi:hypothetical protein
MFKLRTEFSVHKQSISEIKGAEFVIVRISYVEIKGRWCDIIAEKLMFRLRIKGRIRRSISIRNYDCVLVQFPQYHTDILFGGSTAKLLEESFKPACWNESFHDTMKIIVLEKQTLPHKKSTCQEYNVLT